MLSVDSTHFIRTDPVPARHLAVLIALAALAFLLLLPVFWVGFLGSDDSLYWGGASGWLHGFPYIGTSHWTLRHTLVIPIALARRVFGDGMAAMVAPVILYAVGILAVVGVWVGRSAGPCAAGVALALVVTNPQFLLLSSSAYIDLVEIFYLLSGLALFHAAVQRDGELRLLFCAGVALGFAMLSRETTALGVIAVGVLFLMGFGVPRWRYFVVGAGFLLPVGLEFIWLWRSTGVLFYRSNIAVHHDSTINRWVPQGAAVPLIHPVVDPFIMLLLNHNFALLFWLGTPVAVWLWRRRDLRRSERQFVTLAGVVALTWTMVAAFLWNLLPLTPRYFLLPSLLLALLAGVGVARLWAGGYRRLCIGGMGLALCANIAAVSLDNRHYMWGEHTLVEVVRELPSGSIHTSPQTLRRAALLLEWSGGSDRVVDTPPARGDLYYYDPTRPDDDVKPGPGWTAMRTLSPPENAGQWLLERLVGRNRIPAGLWTRLGPGHPPVSIYRVG